MKNSKRCKNITFLITSFIIILLCITILSLFTNTYGTLENTYEAFNDKNQTKNLIFLGDSMFRNETYVSMKESVYSNIKKEFHNDNVKVFAKDGATIHMMPFQLEMLKDDELSEKNSYDKLLSRENSKYNNTDTCIFISFGGNDIINNFIKSKSRISIEDLFSKYTYNLSIVRNKYPQAKIYLATVYYPTSPPYNNYKDVIQKWNDSIITFAKNNDLGVLRVDNYLTEPSDFVYNIEPSISGGKKIARCVKNSL